MLGKLIKLNATVNAAGGRLALCQIEPDLLEVFKITRLDKLLKIYRDDVQALAAVEK